VISRRRGLEQAHAEALQTDPEATGGAPWRDTDRCDSYAGVSSPRAAGAATTQGVYGSSEWLTSVKVTPLTRKIAVRRVVIAAIGSLSPRVR
jgi:hypothetical protein